MHMYSMAGEAIWAAATAGAENSPALFVNLPRRLTPTSRTYPLGFEGITPLPQRVTASQMVAVNTGVQAAADAMAFGIVATDAPDGYTYQLHGREVGWQAVAEDSRAADSVYLTRYGAEAIVVAEAGGPATPAESFAQIQATFDDSIGIVSATATCTQTKLIKLTTVWQALDIVGTDVTIFAHLRPLRVPESLPQAQADGYTLLGMKPFWLYEANEAVRDVRYLPVSAAGPYEISIGLWEPTTGRRWTPEPPHADALVVGVSCR
jgi:hypothetical protein